MEITPLLDWPGLAQGRWPGVTPSPVLGALCWALETPGAVGPESGLGGPRCCLRGGPEGWHVEGKEHGPCPFSGAGFGTQGKHFQTSLNL